MLNRQSHYVAAVIATMTLAGCSSRETVILLPESDGTSGALTVARSGDKEATKISDAYAQARVGGFVGSDTNFAEANPDIVASRYGDVTANLPEPPVSFLLYFETDSAELTSESRAQLPLVRRALTNRPLPIIEIAGHTDTVGSARYNQALSDRRVLAVSAALTDTLGENAADFRSMSMGERDPAVLTADQVEQAENRRVTVTVRSGLGELNIN